MTVFSTKRKSSKTLWSGVLFGGVFALAGVVAFWVVLYSELSKPNIDWVAAMSSSLFLMFFFAPGAGLIWWSFNQKGVIDLVAQAQSGGIPSNQRRLHAIFYGVAAVLVATSVPVLIGAVVEQVKGPMVLLLFLVFAAGFFFAGKRQQQKYHEIGPTLLQPDPVPGCIGGQVGGSFRINSPVQADKLKVRLSCLYTYSSGSGSASSTQTTVLFQSEARPFVKYAGFEGCLLSFVFEVPQDLPESDSPRRRGHIHWELQCSGPVKISRQASTGTFEHWLEFKRQWTIPVMPGVSESNVDLPDEHLEAVQAEDLADAEASLVKQIHMEVRDHGITLISEAGRHKSMWGGFGSFGAGVLAIAAFLLYQSVYGEVPVTMVVLFFGVGLALTGLSLYLAGRRLEVSIEDGRVQVMRSLYGVRLYQRSARITSAQQLSIKSTMSSQSQDRTKTEYFGLYLQYGDRRLKLAEGVEGRGTAELLKATLVSSLEAV